MIFRKEPFFKGHDNYDQLVKSAFMRTLIGASSSPSSISWLEPNDFFPIIALTFDVLMISCVHVHRYAFGARSSMVCTFQPGGYCLQYSQSQK